MALAEVAFPKYSNPERSRSDLNHHANQKNPNNRAYTAAQNNRANQLNPNNSAYHKSRANNQH